MGKLILLRHGESVWNQKNIFTGWVDIGLSDKGVEEALKAGDMLKDIKFDSLFVSTLIRAKLTLYLVLSKNKLTKTAVTNFSSPWAKSYGENDFVNVIESEALNERYYGKLQGKYKDKIKDEFGEAQFKLWRRSYDIAPPEGESLKMTIDRALPFAEKEIFPRVKRGETVLVSAHGNSLRGIVMHLDKLSSEEVVNLEIPTGVPLFYDLSG
jgi:2,3-bisphosphoglycerate-dependent phosphoglycerate mutase